MRIEVGYPLLAFLCDPQIPERIADIGTNGMPEKRWVCRAQIVRTLISKFLANASFAKFREKRRCFAQIVNVCQLTDQVCCSQQAGIVRRTDVLFVFGYRKSRVLDICLDFERIDVSQARFPEALAD